MTIEPAEGGWYLVHVDQDTLSVYVSWTISNDAVGMDGESPISFQIPAVRFPIPASIRKQIPDSRGTFPIPETNRK